MRLTNSVHDSGLTTYHSRNWLDQYTRCLFLAPLPSLGIVRSSAIEGVEIGTDDIFCQLETGIVNTVCWGQIGTEG